MLKRSIAMLCILFILFSSVAFAEFNLSDLSDEDLALLQLEMNAELIKRGIIKEITIPEGIYVAGADVPVGRYIITALSDPTLYATPQILIYPSLSSYLNRNSSSKKLYLINAAMSAGKSCTITLESGYVLYLRGSDYTLKKYSLSMFE